MKYGCVRLGLTLGRPRIEECVVYFLGNKSIRVITFLFAWISLRPRLRLACVKFKPKGPTGKHHGSSSIGRRWAMAFACGKMTGRKFLQVVIKAYIDLIGRNSQAERRMSGGGVESVGLAF